MTILMFLLGLAALAIGAELLVRGASRLGLAIGISLLATGLTYTRRGPGHAEYIVAFGTSNGRKRACGFNESFRYNAI